jgi:hypothetical protein
MRRKLLIAAAAALLSCSDTSGPLDICERISCANADLVVETRITDLANRPLSEPLAPGDTFLVHRRIENLHTEQTDSLWLALYARRLEDPHLNYTYSPVERALDRLAPRGVLELTDTVQVLRFTFTRKYDLRTVISTWESGRRTLIVINVGDRELAVVGSGYQIEVVAMPEQVQTGTTQITQLRHYAKAGALLRISNPYDVALDSLRLYVCVFDIDYCAVNESSALVPQVLPGRETYFDFDFVVDTRNGPRDWWERFDAGLSFCGESILDGHCARVPVRILANFEEICDVVTITAGVVYSDADDECPVMQPLERFARGSAFRFEARAGERYRVEYVKGFGSQHFSDRDGAVATSPSMLEITIPRNGIYYLAIQHRDPVDFRLIRVP